MSKDILCQSQKVYQLQEHVIPEQQIKKHTVNVVELLFNASSTTLTKFNLPTPTLSSNQFSIDKLLLEELDYNRNDLQVEHENLVRELNVEQKNAYENVLKSVLINEGRFFSSTDMVEQGKHFYGRQSSQPLDLMVISSWLLPLLV
ncbi:hypothetical protein PTKIN_Ptkin11bG0177800 [Pterospermum kingtungense]